MNNSNKICRVCGYLQSDSPRDENNNPSWIICDCCGLEVGYHYITIEAIRANRKEWIENGSKWFFPKKKPADWNLEEQLEQIPKEYK